MIRGRHDEDGQHTETHGRAAPTVWSRCVTNALTSGPKP